MKPAGLMLEDRNQMTNVESMLDGFLVKVLAYVNA